jgi:N-acetylmuramoyl-L-alanine amidase
MAYKVYVSPSTQERNKGAGNYGTEEENMQTIGAKVAELLCCNGFQVRRNRPDMELKQVVEDSNAFNPDAHVAIHSNAGGGRGCEAYAWLVDDGKGGYKDTPGRRLAQAIYDEVAKITPAKDRGVKQGNWLYEIKHTKAPAALVEVSFHDDSEDAAWIKASRDAIAEAIAKGICRYFNIAYKKPEQLAQTDTAPNGKLYKVQVGAFQNRGNAEAMLKRIKQAGFDGFIKLE